MKLFKHNQTGRSMVEMLGVLAIIGVLSVGGIAGYSKAMYKHKMNKMTDIISKVFMNITELLSNPNNSNFESNDAIKAGVFDDLTCDTDSGRCQLPYGEIYASSANIGVALDGIDNRKEICIDLLSHHWENGFKDNIKYIAAVTYNGNIIPVYNATAGKVGWRDYDAILSYDLGNIQEVCNSACDPNNGTMCYFHISLTTAS